MKRWGIVLRAQLLFATDNEDTMQRFMGMGEGFRVFDHASGYYVYSDSPSNRTEPEPEPPPKGMDKPDHPFRWPDDWLNRGNPSAK